VGKAKIVPFYGWPEKVGKLLFEMWNANIEHAFMTTTTTTTIKGQLVRRGLKLTLLWDFLKAGH
jgi:hypothetical protein